MDNYLYRMAPITDFLEKVVQPKGASADLYEKLWKFSQKIPICNFIYKIS